MSDEDIGGLVIVTAIVISGSTIIRLIREGGWVGNRKIIPVVIFGFLLALALEVVALISAKLAAILCYLGLVGAFAVNGPSLFTLVGNLGRSPGAEARIQEKTA